MTSEGNNLCDKLISSCASVCAGFIAKAVVDRQAFNKLTKTNWAFNIRKNTWKGSYQTKLSHELDHGDVMMAGKKSRMNGGDSLAFPVCLIIFTLSLPLILENVKSLFFFGYECIYHLNFHFFFRCSLVSNSVAQVCEN